MFWPDYSQLYTENKITELAPYINLKAKARSQKVTIILKSQIDHASCDTCFHVKFGHGIRLLSYCVHWVDGEAIFSMLY